MPHHYTPKVECVCQNCGKDFLTLPAYIRKGGGKYCSADCYHAAHRGENNRLWRGGPVQKSCERCGEAFFVKPYEAETAKYCSYKCLNKANGEKRVGTGKGRYVSEYVFVYAPDDPHANARGWALEHRIIASEMIGRPLRPDEHVHHGPAGKTVNLPSNLQVLTASEHHALHGRTHPRREISRENRRLRLRKVYKEWRAAVLARDDHRCRDCGATGKLRAHHVIPMADDITRALDVENGLTLCLPCHLKRHRKISS
jgi:hypothetical protein